EMLLLARAIQDLDLDDVRVHVGEDALVAEGETLDGSVVVVDGDLEVAGELDGDAVVVGGTLRVGDRGRITGDVRLAGAGIFTDGEVAGSVTNLGDDPDEALGGSARGRERLRERVRAELEDELRSESPRASGPVRRLGDGLGDLIELAVVILLLGVLGGGLALHF